MRTAIWALFSALLLAACEGPVEFSSSPGTVVSADEQSKLKGVWSIQGWSTDESADGAILVKMSSAQALILPLPNGQLSITLGVTALQTSSMESKDRNNWTVTNSAIAIAGTGYVVQIAGQRYLVFQRTFGLLDDYSPPDRTPGFNIFLITMNDRDRMELFNMSNLFALTLEKWTGVTVEKIMGKNIMGKVPYSYVTIPASELTNAIEEADPDKIFSGRDARYRFSRSDVLLENFSR